MNTSDETPNRPDDSQYSDGKIGIQLQRAAGKSPERIDGRLLNLSVRGAKLTLDSPITLKEAVTLRFHNTRLDTELMTGGDVKRLQPQNDGSWTVGCLFTEPLPRIALRNLFRGDRVEQRKSPRYRVVGDAIVDWEAGPHNVTVRLEDVSAGGFQMTGKQPVAIGDRLNLILRLPNHRRFILPSIVRWQLQSADGFAIGCQFLYDQGQHLINAILPEVRTREPIKLIQILKRLGGL